MSAPRPAWMARPGRPKVGPQAQYTITGTNIACGLGPYFASFVEFGENDNKPFIEDLQWVLYNLGRFDEPSRHMVLAATATLFSIPYAVIFGDEQ